MSAIPDSEKAHYAAENFSKYTYQNCSVWFVEESTFAYSQYGEFSLEAEEKAAILKKPGKRDRIRYRVVDNRVLKTYDPETAYLIARSLERGD